MPVSSTMTIASGAASSNARNGSSATGIVLGCVGRLPGSMAHFSIDCSKGGRLVAKCPFMTFPGPIGGAASGSHGLGHPGRPRLGGGGLRRGLQDPALAGRRFLDRSSDRYRQGRRHGQPGFGTPGTTQPGSCSTANSAHPTTPRSTATSPWTRGGSTATRRRTSGARRRTSRSLSPMAPTAGPSPRPRPSAASTSRAASTWHPTAKSPRSRDKRPVSRPATDQDTDPNVRRTALVERRAVLPRRLAGRTPSGSPEDGDIDTVARRPSAERPRRRRATATPLFSNSSEGGVLRTAVR